MFEINCEEGFLHTISRAKEKISELKYEVKLLEIEVADLKHKKNYIKHFFEVKYEGEDDGNFPNPNILNRDLLLENIRYLEDELKNIKECRGGRQIKKNYQKIADKLRGVYF